MSLIALLFDLNASTILLLVISFLITFLSWKKFFYIDPNKPNMPPYPVRPWPIFGHLFMLTSNPVKQFRKWQKDCGDLFSLDFMGKRIVVLNGHDGLKDVLVKKADKLSRPQTYMMILNNETNIGILNSAGPNWKEQRTVALAILRSFGMGKKILAEKIEKEVDVYIRELAELKGKPSNVKMLTHISVLNIICSIIIGKRYEHDDPYFARFVQMLGKLMSQIAGTSVLNHFKILRNIPGDPFKANLIKELSFTVGEMLEEIIVAEKKKFEENETAEPGKENFIFEYLKEKKSREDRGEPTRLDDLNLVAIIKNLFGAGSETTGNTIMFFLLHMMHRPAEQERIYKEIVDVVGLERRPNMHDQSKLNYLNATIMETQRMSTVAPVGLQRLVEEDLQVKGYDIPAGSVIMPVIESAMLDSKIWGDPETFRPSRFLDEDGSLLKPDAWIPYSLGKRICLGEAMAKMELYLFLSAVMQKFFIAPPSDKEPLPTTEGIYGLTISPVPFDVRLIERELRIDN